MIKDCCSLFWLQSTELIMITIISNIMGKITLNLDWVKLYSYTDWTFVFSNILPGFFLRQLTFIDMICYVIWDNVTHSTRPIRWSRPLRPLFLINFPDGKQVGLSLNISVWIMKISNGRKNTFLLNVSFQIRRAFRNIRRTVPEIMNVLILFLLSVLLFALLALKLFSRRWESFSISSIKLWKVK